MGPHEPDPARWTPRGTALALMVKSLLCRRSGRGEIMPGRRHHFSMKGDRPGKGRPSYAIDPDAFDLAAKKRMGADGRHGCGHRGVPAARRSTQQTSACEFLLKVEFGGRELAEAIRAIGA